MKQCQSAASSHKSISISTSPPIKSMRGQCKNLSAKSDVDAVQKFWGGGESHRAHGMPVTAQAQVTCWVAPA